MATKKTTTENFKMFETKVGEQNIGWVVGEGGVKSITQYDMPLDPIVVIVENEKFGDIRLVYHIDKLPFYATA